MKTKAYIILAFLSVLTTVSAYTYCKVNQNKCSLNSECCSKCCFDGICLKENSCEPCLKMNCNPGHVCETHTIQCFRAPCPPIGVCVPVRNPVNRNPCSVAFCRYRCKNVSIPCLTEPCPVTAQCIEKDEE